MKVLVLDIGGSNVKPRVAGREETAKIATGRKFTPARLLAGSAKVTKG